MSDQTRTEQLSVSLTTAIEGLQAVGGAVGDLRNHIEALLKENAALRGTLFPEGEETATPAALILSCIRKWYAWGNPNDDVWAPHLNGMDAIIARVEAGDVLNEGDLAELDWWSHNVMLSSMVLPNAVTFAFIDVVGMLRIQAERAAQTEGRED